jgi:CHC2 zinc finger
MSTTAPCKAAADPHALDSYLRMLAGPAPGARLLEIRFALRHRDMGRLFIAAHSAPGAGRLIQRLAVRTDVYVGVCLRSRRSGGRDAVDRSHLVFVEIDAADAVDRLRVFRHPPSMIVSSGTAGHAHAYFALSAPVTVPELERANRGIAHALGGDLASVDSARILRPPSSWNHKHSPPSPVELIELDRTRRYDFEQLIDGLDDPPARLLASVATRRRTERTEIDRRLLAISAAEYVRALAGVSPDRAGKIHCPFHEDRTPSLQLYEDGTWYCYGPCNAGGSIFDFAARVWRMDTKGRDFLKLRTRLAHELLPVELKVGTRIAAVASDPRR